MPTSPRSAWNALLLALSSRASTIRISSKKTVPARVSETPRLLRLRSCTPSSSSRLLIWVDRGGWETCSRCAAREKLPSSVQAAISGRRNVLRKLFLSWPLRFISTTLREQSVAQNVQLLIILQCYLESLTSLAGIVG